MRGSVSDDPATTPPAAASLGPRGGLYERIRLARVWLPLLIVAVVLLWQTQVIPRGGDAFQFWAQVLFYSVLGPLATFITLNWIAREVRLHELAQVEMGRLLEEVTASHELLGSIHEVTARFAAAPDLETTVDAVARGVTSVTGAVAVALIVGPPGLGISHRVNLDDELEKDVLARDRAAQERAGEGRHATIKGVLERAGRRLGVLSRPLAWGGTPEGSLHAYYDTEPDERQVEAFSILAAQFSAAAEAIRLRTRDLLTLVEVDRSIRAEGNLERLLAAVLKQMMARVDAGSGGVFLADESGVLQLATSAGVPAGSQSVAWRVGEGIVGTAASGRDPLILANLRPEQRETAGPILRSAGSAVALPLWSQDQLLGVVVLAHPQSQHFDPGSIPFLWLLANQVTLAVRNAGAYLQSEELAITEERSRIAREIHDGVAQMLAFTALKLDLVARLKERDPAKAVAELETARETVRETIKELRRSLFALRPVDLERHGFVETIRMYLADFGPQNAIRAELETGVLPPLSVKSETVLFRIFQEAMHNVAKHSRARAVKVTLGTAPDGMAFVEVSDDGIGFDKDSIGDRVTSAGGLGLIQMRERVTDRGGRFELTASADTGTTVYAAVPV